MLLQSTMIIFFFITDIFIIALYSCFLNANMTKLPMLIFIWSFAKIYVMVPELQMKIIKYKLLTDGLINPSIVNSLIYRISLCWIKINKYLEFVPYLRKLFHSGENKVCSHRELGFGKSLDSSSSNSVNSSSKSLINKKTYLLNRDV